MRYPIGPLSLMLLLALAGPAAGQTCLGAASYGAGAFRLGGSIGVSDGAKSFSAGAALGAASGPYASLSVAEFEYDDIDETGKGIAVDAGYAVDLTRARTVQFCPRVAFFHQSGPNIDTGFGVAEISGRALAVGGSLGALAHVSSVLDFVPFVGASYSMGRSSVKYLGESESVSSDAGSLDVGAGFVIARGLTLQPSVSFPLGVEGAKSTFVFAIAFNFGPTFSRR